MNNELHIAGLMGMIGGPTTAANFLQQSSNDRTNWGQLPKPRDGIEWGEPVDDMFVHAKLPEGWHTKRTDHHLYTNLCDNNGYVRAVMMIHSLDQDAWTSTRTRVTTGHTNDKPHLDNQPIVPTIVTSNGMVLWRGSPIPARRRTGDWYDKPSEYDLARKRASEVLNAAISNWKDPLANWDLSDEDLRTMLPASESEAPKGETYSLHTTFYHNAHDRYAVDSNIQPIGIFANDEEAIKEITSLPLSKSYEKIDFRISCNGRRVHSWTYQKPPKYHFNNRYNYWLDK